jgi:hypothetical protein
VDLLHLTGLDDEFGLLAVRSQNPQYDQSPHHTESSYRLVPHRCTAFFPSVHCELAGNLRLKYTPDLHSESSLFVNNMMIGIAALNKSTPENGQASARDTASRSFTSNYAHFSGLLPLNATGSAQTVPSTLRSNRQALGCTGRWRFLTDAP